jgi:hypothetical protein
MVAKIEDGVQQQLWQEAMVSIRFLARVSMVAALAMDVNDRVAGQWGKRGRHNIQIKATAEKMAFDCSGIGSEDGI